MRWPFFEERVDAFERVAVMERIDKTIAFGIEMSASDCISAVAISVLIRASAFGDMRPSSSAQAMAVSSAAPGFVTRFTTPSFVQTRGADRFCLEQDFGGERTWQGAREEPRAAAIGREAHARVRHHELGVVGGDEQVAREREREARARRRAFHGGDHRFRR